jgi:DNA-binding HxlR family transcriptional regulator
MEARGLIARLPYSEPPAAADYRLTAKGRSLGPALHDWGRSEVC